MAFADPQSITVNAVPKSMPRVLGPTNQNNSSTYQMLDKTFILVLAHRSLTKKGAPRSISTSSFTQRAIVTDPLTSVNDWDFVTVSFQIDRPEVGFTVAQIQQMATGFKTWLTDTVIESLIGGQS